MSAEQIESKFHKYAFLGKKSKLKNLIKSENANVNGLDSRGNTALFYACQSKKRDCVKLLLENNANPNERCINGATAVHAAAHSGNRDIVNMLIEHGGDLRLHDNDGKNPKAWAMFQTNPNLRGKMLAYIEEARFKAMTSAGPNGTPLPRNTEQSTLFCNPPSKPNDQMVNACSVGFGTLYKSSNEIIGVPIVIPVINESDLLHDNSGPTLNNGAFMVYESMRWKDIHLVTIKRLHSNTVEGGQVDLLIEELEFLKRLNHFPKIISLMGFCRTNNADSMVLMFERVAVGSLFNILHEIKLSKPPKLKSINEIMLNICDALLYLHEKSIIHCYVNSHSILLTSHYTAKLANLEYAVEKSMDPATQKRSKVVKNQYLNCAWNWLAPEIMSEEELPTEDSDMYSFCAVMWELFNMKIPWQNMDWEQIKHTLLVKQETLPVDLNEIPIPFSRIIKDGLSLSSVSRFRFDHVKFTLETFQASLNETISIQKQPPRSSNKVTVKHMKETPATIKVLNRANTNSYSEGIASINEAVRFNEMGTLNSLEEFDKFSQLSTNSFIYCDAFKAEIHLTKGMNRRRHSMRTSRTKSDVPINIRKTRHASQDYYDSKLSKSSKKSPKDVHLDSIGLVSSTSSMKMSSSKTSRTPVKRPPHPPPPPPPINLPPPPPLHPPMKPPTSFSTPPPSQMKPNLATIPPNLIDSTPHKNTPPLGNFNPNNYKHPMSPAYMTSPNKSRQSLRNFNSKSVDSSPRNKDNADHMRQKQCDDLNENVSMSRSNRNDYNDSKSRQDTTGTGNFAGIGSGISSANDIDTNLFILKRDKSNPSPANIQVANASQQLHQKPQQNLDRKQKEIQLDKLLQTQQIKQLNKYENIMENMSRPTPDDKRKYFRSNKCSELNDLSIPYQDFPVQYQQTRENNSRNAYNNSPNKKLDLSALSVDDNTIDKNGDLSEKCKKTQKQLIEDLTQITTENGNNPIRPKNIPYSMTSSGSGNKIISRSGSYNKLKDDVRTGLLNSIKGIPAPINMAATKSKKSNSFTSSSSSDNYQNPQQQGPYKSHQSRRLTSSISESNQQEVTRFKSNSVNEPISNTSVYAPPPKGQISNLNKVGHGSVKSLVHSFEEFPLKERNESENKIQKLREERNKELFEVVEKSRQFINVNNDNYDSERDFKDDADQRKLENEKESDEIKRQQLQIQLQQQIENVNAKNQYLIQKELSTISERTEHSSSVNGYNAANAAAIAALGASNNTNNTSMTPASPLNTNHLISNSRATTTTKSIRHIDPNRFNFLDNSSTGASGDALSVNNKSGLQSSSTPIQTNNLNKTTSNNSIRSTSLVNTNKHQSDPGSNVNYNRQHQYSNQNQGRQNELFELSRASDTYVSNTCGTIGAAISTATSSSTTITAIPLNRDSPQQKSSKQSQTPSTSYKSQSTVNAIVNKLQKKMSPYDENNNRNIKLNNQTGNDSNGSDTEAERQDNQFLDSNISSKISKLVQQHQSSPGGDLFRCQTPFTNHQTRNNSSNNNYSSQEDFISTIHNDSSLECSEGVLLYDFDRLAIKDNSNLIQMEKFERPLDDVIYNMALTHSQMQNQRYNLPSPPPHIKNNTQNVYKTNHYENENFQIKAQMAGSSSSSSSIAAVSTVSSLPETSSSDSTRRGYAGPGGDYATPADFNENKIANTTTTSSKMNKHGKLGNVRTEKHVIDTTQFQGYSCQIETRSNDANQYHIKSCLTNEQTGHSLLLANTKVQTPKMMTKVIID